MRPAILLAVTLPLLASAGAGQGTPASSQLLDRIERFQSGLDEANRLSGVLLIARGDSILLHHAFGARDPVRRLPNRLDTPIPVASITKAFTQIALTQLVVEGRLHLTDKVSDWIRDFPRGDEIQVVHLLNHRGGIPHRVVAPGEDRRAHSVADVVAAAARHPLVFSPGSQSSYSTAGFGVLARILELADGRTFHEILRARVFAPAGMTSSFDLTGPVPSTGFAGSWLPREGKLVADTLHNLSSLAGGGSSVSTAEDLLRWVRTLRRGAYPGVRYEYLAPRGAVVWNGASAGYFAWVDVNPTENLTTIWVGNSWGGAAGALQSALPALLRGESPTPPSVPARADAPAPSVLGEFVGDYTSRIGAFIPVRLEDGLRYDDNYLVPISDGAFWNPGTAERITFVRDASNAVIAMERASASGVARLPKIR